MKRIILVVLLLSLFLFGCASNKGIDEKTIKCPALCIDLCTQNGMAYSDNSKQSIENTKCSIVCECSKIITYDFITKQ